MAARPPRKCSIVGDGIETFGVRVVTLARNWKSRTWMGRTCRTLPVTCMTGGAKSTTPSFVWNFDGTEPWVTTPESC